jgi:hypothetical protein
MSPFAMWVISCASTPSISCLSMLRSRPVETASRLRFFVGPVANAFTSGESYKPSSGTGRFACCARRETVAYSHWASSLRASGPISSTPSVHLAIWRESSSETPAAPKPQIAQ